MKMLDALQQCRHCFTRWLDIGDMKPFALHKMFLEKTQAYMFVGCGSWHIMLYYYLLYLMKGQDFL